MEGCERTYWQTLVKYMPPKFLGRAGRNMNIVKHPNMTPLVKYFHTRAHVRCLQRVETRRVQNWRYVQRVAKHDLQQQQIRFGYSATCKGKALECSQRWCAQFMANTVVGSFVSRWFGNARKSSLEELAKALAKFYTFQVAKIFKMHEIEKECR